MSGIAFEKYKIGELGKVITGRTPPSSKPECFGDKYPFITPCDMHDRKNANNTDRYLSEDGAKLLKNNLIPSRSVSVSCIGWQMGKSIMVTRPSFTNQQLNTIIPNEKVDPDYLYYSLVTKRSEFFSLGSGVGVRTPILNKSAFSNIEIFLPPLNDQKNIAESLLVYDNLIENNNRRIAILEEMAQSLYREWFVKFRYPGYESTRFIDSSLGKIPKGWGVFDIEVLIKRYQTGKKYNNKTALPEGAVPILDQGKSGIIGYHNDEPGVIASEEEPIIVFANHTCYQKIIQCPFSAIQNVLPFKSIDGELERDLYWLHYATKDMIEFNDYKGHWPEFISKKVILPPRSLCSDFGKFTKSIEIQKYKYECQINKLKQQRDMLLPKVISGAIHISDKE